MRRFVLAALVGCVSILPCQHALAQISPTASESLRRETTAESLRGLVGVHIVVNWMFPEPSQMGINVSRLEKDIEALLREAGIRVLSQAESARSAGGAQFFVKFHAMKVREPSGEMPEVWAYILSTTLKQEVTLKRKSDIRTTAITWRHDTMGEFSDEGLGAASGVYQTWILKTLEIHHVGRFAANFFEANPKASTKRTGRRGLRTKVVRYERASSRQVRLRNVKE